MKSVKGIDRMFLSGTIATFTFEKGTKIDTAKLEKQLTKSCKDNGVKFVKLTKRETQRAKAAFVAKTPGLT